MTHPLRKEGIRHCYRCKGFDRTLYFSYATPSGSQYFICRECNTERIKRYRNTECGRKKIYAAVYRSIKKYKYKQAARATLKNAIRCGKIAQPSCCSFCKQNTVTEAHHPDYSKPLEVIWMCRVCHAYLHKNNK